MKNKRGGFTPQENLISILPSVMAGLIVFSTIIVANLVYFLPQEPLYRVILIIYGISGSIYLSFYYFIYTAALNKSRFSWVNAVIAAIALCSMAYFFSAKIDHLLYTLVLIAALSSSLISTRGPAYFLVVSVTSFYFLIRSNQRIMEYEWVIHLGLSIAALMGVETIQQLKNMATRQINRLETINELSRQIVSTLDTKQVFALLNATFQSALEADSYYIGILDGDFIKLELLYDDGEYFHDLRLSKKGTLSNWVITHQQELFLPDMRKGIQLDGVEVINIGKDKPTLSWMGIPMHGAHVDGIMAISSYRPNAFDRSDMELLSTIAQRAALALDNTYHHALVQQQARLDSLTKVYNHGYFIQTLHEQAQICKTQNQPLSLIMLDIDFFKQYNDTFGHPIGDEILVSLCVIIRSHIKSTDSIGRWGGEEFAIALPNTDGHQAALVAQRIRETLGSLKIRNSEQFTIPIPTISMGLAVFPLETNDTTKLIDLADKRLYTAKERGRDQIEPALAFWKK